MLLAHEDGPRVNVALVGCGNHAYRSLLPCFDYVPFRLVATCDPNRERAERYAAHFGAEAAYGSLAEVWFAQADEATRLRRLLARHVEFGKSDNEARRWMERVDGPNARRIEAARDAADLVVRLD